MEFTQVEQDYITANKEELKNNLLQDFIYKSIEINDKRTLSPEQKLDRLNAINASLNNDFNILEQPTIEFGEPSPELSRLIRQGTQFTHIRDIKETSTLGYNTTEFDYITKQSSSDEEDATSLKEGQSGENVAEPRDPSIIIPEAEQNPDELKSQILYEESSYKEKENIPSEISESFLEAEKVHDALFQSIIEENTSQEESTSNSESQSVYDNLSDASSIGEDPEDLEEELYRQEKLSNSQYQKEHEKTIEELDRTIAELDVKNEGSGVTFKSANFLQDTIINLEQPDITSSQKKQDQEEDHNFNEEIATSKGAIKEPQMPSVPEDDDMSFGAQDKAPITQETSEQSIEEVSQLSDREFTKNGQERIVDEEGNSFYFPLQENSESVERSHGLEPEETENSVSFNRNEVPPTAGERVVLPEGSVYIPHNEFNGQPSDLEPAKAANSVIGNVKVIPPTAPTQSVLNSDDNQEITGKQTSEENEPSLISEKSLDGVVIGSKIYLPPDESKKSAKLSKQQQGKPSNNVSSFMAASYVPPTARTNHGNKPFNVIEFFQQNKEKIVSILKKKIAQLKRETDTDIVQRPKQEDIDLLIILKDDLEALRKDNFDKISQKTKEILIRKKAIPETVILTDAQKGIPTGLPKEEIKSSDKEKKKKGPLIRFFTSVRKRTKKNKPVTPLAPPAVYDTVTNVRGENEETVIIGGYRTFREKQQSSAQQPLEKKVSTKGSDLKRSEVAPARTDTPNNYESHESVESVVKSTSNQENGGLPISQSFLEKAQPLQPTKQTTQDDNIKAPFTPPEPGSTSNFGIDDGETILNPGNNTGESSQPKKKRSIRNFLIPRNKGKKNKTKEDVEASNKESKKESKKGSKKRGIFARK